jgi:hypothetical protein
MIIIQGTAAAFNFTYGPALIYRGPRSIDEIYRQGEPVVVFADMIPIEELRKIELTRVRGFVFEEGTAADDEIYNFLMNEKRAAVIGAAGALDVIEPGKWVIVDGVEGYVCIDPTPEMLERFQEHRKKGPPKDTATQTAALLRATIEGVAKQREEEKAKKEEAQAKLEQFSKDDVKRYLAQPEAGLIGMLLTGLPIPGAKEAEGDHHHGHDHGRGDGAEGGGAAPRELEAPAERRRAGRGREPVSAASEAGEAGPAAS